MCFDQVLCKEKNSVARQYVNKWAQLYSSKTLFTYTEIWISYNLHMSENIILLFIFIPNHLET